MNTKTGDKFKYGKRGLAENPIHQYVALTLAGRQYLGQVKDFHYNDVRGGWFLTVYYFNGKPWPFQPVANAVEVLRETVAS